ncbi:unnamed protein product [Kuraishia capsulata CBS 1993]|uniref:t-SNARE coiled-coil homology domain-containing protein n=1 Tax=Kuraishia capsulata CBS 1993 TaxID=1382522 RepID=W6ML87_9ASCO|nr:uncharacterized protein KUCA_T00001507001 [Kuraishia capsulata CBS 1993]CDK25537.1 unnamed protein product [Kuraishia capsulata CBS 1993]
MASSYDEAIALEEQPIYRDVPEFDGLVEKLSNRLLEINNSLNNLSRNVTFLEEKLRDIRSRDDTTEEVSSTVNKHLQTGISLINKIMAFFKEISPSSKEIQSIDVGDLNVAQKFVRDKLVQSTASALRRFNELQQKFTDLEEMSNVQDEQAFGLNQESHTNGSNGFHQQQLQQEQEQIIINYEPINAEELEYQQNLIAERETEIENIANGVEELNELFQDLSTLVTSQGDIVDNIESNLYSVAADTRHAHKALLKTERYQRRSRGICLWIMIILGVVLLFLIMIIFA